MAGICVIGVEVNARTQRRLLGAEIVTLAAFAAAALFRVYTVMPATLRSPPS
jgi:hypothetical protein